MPPGCLGKEDCCRGVPAIVRLGSCARAGSDASPTAPISTASAHACGGRRRRRHCRSVLGLLPRHLACGPDGRARPGSGKLTNMNATFDSAKPRDALEAEIDAEAHDIVGETVVPAVGVGIESDTAQVRSAKVSVQVFKTQAQVAIERVLGARAGRPT